MRAIILVACTLVSPQSLWAMATGAINHNNLASTQFFEMKSLKALNKNTVMDAALIITPLWRSDNPVSGLWKEI